MTIFTHNQVILAAGKKFRNRKGSMIVIKRALPTEDVRFEQGFRFEDASGQAYTEQGQINLPGTEGSTIEHLFDLVADWDLIERTVETHTREEAVLGFMGRMGQRIDNGLGVIRRHPVKTAVGVTAAGGVGYAGYHYYEYGTVLPVNDSIVNDAAQVGSAIASIFAKFR